MLYFAKKILECNYQDAEDVVMIVWTNYYKQVNPESAHNMLMTMCRNECLNLLKKKNVRIVELKDTEMEDILVEVEVLERLREAFINLPGKFGEVMTMFYKQGLTRQQIGIKMNITDNTVSNHLKRGRKFIKEKMLKQVLC